MTSRDETLDRDGNREAIQGGVTTTGGVRTFLVDDDGRLQTGGNGVPPDTVGRLDYDARIDYQPVYVGWAPSGTATSAAAWEITKLAYDAATPTNRVIAVETLDDQVWDDRASLGWSI